MQKELNIDVELFGKFYPELKTYALKICKLENKTALHQDLLHETIHEYLAHPKKKQIQHPVIWIKCVMWNGLHKPNSNFYRKYILHDLRHDPIKTIHDEPEPNCPTKYQLVSQHLDAHFDFVERVLFQLRLKGYSNKEISERFEITYDTVCRLNRETKQKLAGNVKFN